MALVQASERGAGTSSLLGVCLLPVASLLPWVLPAVLLKHGLVLFGIPQKMPWGTPGGFEAHQVLAAFLGCRGASEQGG